MTDAAVEPEEAPKKSKKPLIIILAVTLLLSGASFSAVYFGLLNSVLPGGQSEAAEETPKPIESSTGKIAFVPLTPLTVSLSHDANNRHLRFSGQLEVHAHAEEEVTFLMPRVTDVLNGYLSAVDAPTVERPGALVLLRAQMLRRVQLVTGPDMVRDLLVTEFVLN